MRRGAKASDFVRSLRGVRFLHIRKLVEVARRVVRGGATLSSCRTTALEDFGCLLRLAEERLFLLRFLSRAPVVIRHPELRAWRRVRFAALAAVWRRHHGYVDFSRGATACGASALVDVLLRARRGGHALDVAARNWRNVGERVRFSGADGRARHRLVQVLAHGGRNLRGRTALGEGGRVEAVRGKVGIALATTLYVLLQQQVVRCRHVVVLVCLDATLSVLYVKAEVL